MTTPTDDFFQQDPGQANKNEPPKDPRWGRYLLPYPGREGGKQYPHQRATTFIKCLEDKSALGAWGERMTAVGLSQRPDLVALAATVTDPGSEDGKSTLNEVVKTAKTVAGTDAKANLGTALHAFAEVIDSGGDTSKIPAAFHADLSALFNELARQGIKVLRRFRERVVFNQQYDVAGKFDYILQLADGSFVIGDLKTRDGELYFGEIAMQLATYAYSDVIYNYETQQFEPMPNVRRDIAVVIHLPVGRGQCYVYQVDIRAGWWACGLAAGVHQWRKTKQLAVPFQPGFVPPAAEMPDAVDLATAHQPAPIVPAVQAVPTSDPFAAPAQPVAAAPVAPVAPYVPDETLPGGSDWKPAEQVTAGPIGTPAASTWVPVPDAAPAPAALLTQGQIAENTGWMPSPQQVEQAVAMSNGTGPVAQALPAATTTPVASETAATELSEFDALMKHDKATLQKMLRELDPSANVARQRKNLATEILSRRAGGSSPQASTQPVDNDAAHAASVAAADAAGLEHGSLEATQAAYDRRQGALNAAQDAVPPGNPFASPTPVAGVVYTENYYLESIELAPDSAALSVIWQHARDNQVPWTEALNQAGIARMRALTAA